MRRPTRVLGRATGIAVGAGIARAAGAGAVFTARTAIAERKHKPMHPDVPVPAATAALAGAVALDASFVMPMGLLTSLMPLDDYATSSSELDEAVRFYDARGWIDNPSGYFVSPPPLTEVDTREVRRRRGTVEVVRFPSGWTPHPGEPGGARWRAFRKSSDAYATMLRHTGEPRPWVVYIHGSGLGRVSDVDRYRLRRLHQELGVNVLLPVLPLHAQRREGMRTERQFPSNVYPVNNVLGLSQSVWDIRRLLSWLRDHESAPHIGVYGFSLGSYVTSLLSTIESDLAVVLAVVPGGDLAESLRVVEPTVASKRAAHRQVHDWRSALVHQVVSPLARPCLVPHERRHIIAGVGDRVAPPPGALLLWRHWGEPDILWRPRGHLTTAHGAAYDAHVDGILRRSGVEGPATGVR